MFNKRSIIWYMGLPVLALLFFTPWSREVDQIVTNFFYKEGKFSSNAFTHLIYHYGFFPAWGLAGSAFFLLIGSYFFSFLRRWRSAAIFFLATLAMGPGILVHTVLKDNWGRPRPKQVIEYGGQQPFRAFYEPNFLHQPEPSKSFPSGHSSMGYYFFTLALLGKHYGKKKIYYSGLLLALGLGGILSLVRMAQGGHFLSDTVVSALIMWLTSLSTYYFVFRFNRLHL